MKPEIPRTITREFIQANRQIIFLYANDLQNAGTEGQAAIARGEPNAYCIPTRWKNCDTDARYFLDSQEDKIIPIWQRIFQHLNKLPEQKIVLPGLLDCDLGCYAPHCYSLLESFLFICCGYEPS